MIEETVVTKVTVYRSSEEPSVETHNPDVAKIITWADMNPSVWKIAKSRQSVYGLGSCVHIGWAQQSSTPSALLQRVASLYKDIPAVVNGRTIFNTRAELAMQAWGADYRNVVRFVQHDGTYDRLSFTFDVTPTTLSRALQAFVDWCDSPPMYTTRSVIAISECPRGSVVVLEDRDLTPYADVFPVLFPKYKRAKV